jgi:hypothetical protein
MSSPTWPHENLRNLEKTRALLPERATPAEMATHLAAADSYLADATNKTNSVAGRYLMAYAASHSLALAALRANDYRTAQEKGHRRLVFDLLPVTCGVRRGDALALHRAHEKRNTIEYAGDAVVTGQEMNDLISVTTRVSEAAREWIRTNRPELEPAVK